MSPREKAKRGRPPLLEEERRAHRITFKLTEAEMEELQRDAKRAKLPVPVHARALVLAGIRK